MAEECVQRRLAAILAADLVGYSRLMGEDEDGTLAALTTHRTELIEPSQPAAKVQSMSQADRREINIGVIAGDS